MFLEDSTYQRGSPKEDCPLLFNNNALIRHGRDICSPSGTRSKDHGNLKTHNKHVIWSRWTAPFKRWPPMCLWYHQWLTYVFLKVNVAYNWLLRLYILATKKSNCHKSRGLFLPCCNNLVTIAINQSILKSQSIRSNQIASQLLIEHQCSTIIMNQVYVGVWIIQTFTWVIPSEDMVAWL